MGDARIDRAKGRVKEAAGALTGDDKLKKEGQAEQVVADVKDAVEKVVEKAADLVKGK